MLLAAPGAAVPTPGAAVKGGVTVTHVPGILPPEPEPGEGRVDAKGEGREEVPPIEGVPDAETCTDLYRIAPEAIALALQAPQIQIPEESCRLQGIRLSRYCQRHNIVLPPYIDVLPIASRGISDYVKFATDLSVAVKERKERKIEEKAAKATESGAPEGIKIPESSVEHVAVGMPGVPADFDAEKALKATHGAVGMSSVPADFDADKALKRATDYRKK